MILNILLPLYIVLYFVPAFAYLICARPKLDRKALWVTITGVLMAIAMVLPIAGMSSVIFLVVWVYAIGALLSVSAIVWIVGAVKKKQEFLAGPVITGVTSLCSGALIGNWIAAIAAIVFLIMLFRFRFDLSFE